MAFIRRIKKREFTYLAEVENKWVNGKVIQKHIKYVGKELNGKKILSGSIADAEITKVTIWAPLLILNTIAKQINLSKTLGDYGEYLLSLAYAHCLDPKSINKMEDWYQRTDLHKILGVQDVSEKKLYNALDSINDENLELIQRKIFRSVQDTYKIIPKSYFFDVTNVYFHGTECSIAKKGKNKDGKYLPQVQIGLAVTENEIPIFHKTFEGNIFDSRVLKDTMTSLHELNIESAYIIWDRGVTSESNIIDAKKAGFEVICGLAIKQKVKEKVEEIIKNKNFIQLENRVRLKNTILYCVKQKYNYGVIKGDIVVCYNEETARLNREKRIDNIHKAIELIKKNRPFLESVKKYLRGNKINKKELFEAQKYDGYSVLFSTKDLKKEDIVKPYFEKDKVEKAFRSLKSILGLRPIKHWLEERVKSHIFICYLSYLLISLLDYKLRKTKVSALTAIDLLSTAHKVYLKDSKTNNEFEKIVTLTKQQEMIMKAVDKKILKPSV